MKRSTAKGRIAPRLLVAAVLTAGLFIGLDQFGLLESWPARPRIVVLVD